MNDLTRFFSGSSPRPPLSGQEQIVALAADTKPQTERKGAVFLIATAASCGYAVITTNRIWKCRGAQEEGSVKVPLVAKRIRVLPGEKRIALGSAGAGGARVRVHFNDIQTSTGLSYMTFQFSRKAVAVFFASLLRALLQKSTDDEGAGGVRVAPSDVPPTIHTDLTRLARTNKLGAQFKSSIDDKMRDRGALSTAREGQHDTGVSGTVLPPPPPPPPILNPAKTQTAKAEISNPRTRLEAADTRMLVTSDRYTAMFYASDERSHGVSMESHAVPAAARSPHGGKGPLSVLVSELSDPDNSDTSSEDESTTYISYHPALARTMKTTLWSTRPFLTEQHPQTQPPALPPRPVKTRTMIEAPIPPTRRSSGPIMFDQPRDTADHTARNSPRVVEHENDPLPPPPLDRPPPLRKQSSGVILAPPDDSSYNNHSHTHSHTPTPWNMGRQLEGQMEGQMEGQRDKWRNTRDTRLSDTRSSAAPPLPPRRPRAAHGGTLAESSSDAHRSDARRSAENVFPHSSKAATASALSMTGGAWFFVDQRVSQRFGPVSHREIARLWRLTGRLSETTMVWNQDNPRVRTWRLVREVRRFGINCNIFPKLKSVPLTSSSDAWFYVVKAPSGDGAAAHSSAMAPKITQRVGPLSTDSMREAYLDGDLSPKSLVWGRLLQAYAPLDQTKLWDALKESRRLPAIPKFARWAEAKSGRRRSGGFSQES